MISKGLGNLCSQLKCDKKLATVVSMGAMKSSKAESFGGEIFIALVGFWKVV